MKVLYAIQGTGNGHLSRARDVIPALQRRGLELDILVSGIQADIHIPNPIKYQLKGLSFIFGKQGNVNLWRTYIKSNAARLQKEIRSIPIEDYDLVINDFEPVSAWACKLKNKPCISFSHQAAVLSPMAPKPEKNDLMGKFILKNYAPTTQQFGLHFQAYEDKVYTPIIRQDIRKADVKDGNHYTVYLPSYSDGRILKTLSEIPNVKWEVFSKHNKVEFFGKNISIRPITNEAFVGSMVGSKGVLCGAGFETPAEALYLGKKIMVIPMKGQYEQQCNSAALKEMGVPVIKSLKNKHLNKIRHWIESDDKTEVDYPDITEQIVRQILEEVVLG
ncbi:glycosyl transferase [Arenibacter sp. F26102]|uniref:glycosyltransferase family protein n=1 Tax=Arenibacter sp. F26102 TaxID=2926416 RepID=UPI001FF0F12C|nr:glycosyltransferase family protein [Arenibacter sp. F26102]MCK0144508.1 glycosyl transferase [Arenibacter sp. F26102]